MIETTKYTLKIWLTTVMAAPLWFVLLRIFNDTSIHGMFNTYLLLLTVGFVFSVVTGLVFFIGVYFILSRNMGTMRRKGATQILGLLLAILTFAYAISDFDSFQVLLEIHVWHLLTPYALCLAASIHFYKLPQPYIEHQENSTT